MNIDFHAHILPGADHGSDGLKTSLGQLRLAKEAGIDLITATPHFYPQRESAEDFFERREATAAELRKGMEGGAYPEVLVGSETNLCRGLHHLDQVEALCLEGTRILLLELPWDFSFRYYEDTVSGLLYDRKLTVVLAHIDRYSTNSVEALMEMGCLAQLNAESFCHFRTRRRSMDWAKEERIVALGSDIHGLQTGYRYFDRMRQRLGATYDQVMKRTQELLGR